MTVNITCFLSVVIKGQPRCPYKKINIENKEHVHFNRKAKKKILCASTRTGSVNPPFGLTVPVFLSRLQIKRAFKIQKVRGKASIFLGSLYVNISRIT